MHSNKIDFNDKTKFIECDLPEVYMKINELEKANKYYYMKVLLGKSYLSTVRPSLSRDNFPPKSPIENEKTFIKIYHQNYYKKNRIVLYHRKGIYLTADNFYKDKYYNYDRTGMINYKVYIEIPFNIFIKNNHYYSYNNIYNKAAMSIKKYNKYQTSVLLEEIKESLLHAELENKIVSVRKEDSFFMFIKNKEQIEIITNNQNKKILILKKRALMHRMPLGK